MIIDGYAQCPRCRSNMYRNEFPKCVRCGTDYDDYKNQEMINNLKRFGFEEVVEYHSQHLIQRLFESPKVKDTYLKWGKIIARRLSNTSNREMYFETKTIGIFNTYGDYENVERSLKYFLRKYMQENELYIKSQKREQLINQIL